MDDTPVRKGTRTSGRSTANRKPVASQADDDEEEESSSEEEDEDEDGQLPVSSASASADNRLGAD